MVFDNATNVHMYYIATLSLGSGENNEDRVFSLERGATGLIIVATGVLMTYSSLPRPACTIKAGTPAVQ